MNRYTIFALIMIAVMVLFASFAVGDDDTRITGYADDIHQSENGFVFTITDADGNMTKAFMREQVDDELHIFKGNYSSDGGIFFVNGIE